MPYVKGTPEERFWMKVHKTPTCWLWIASHNGNGYGMFYASKRVYAHRFSYELHIGPIPQSMHVLHNCDNPSCVNPSHLWIGTNVDNIHDRMNKGRGLTTSERRKSMLGKVPSGDDHWTRRHPDNVLRGANHWMHRS